jgi:hypothetical protein
LTTPKLAVAPIYAKSVKSISVYAEMMVPAKLRNTFKCMHTTCSFSTDSEKRFVKHFAAHERILRENSHDFFPGKLIYNNRPIGY